MSDPSERRTFITNNAASDAPTWAELLPPPPTGELFETHPDAYGAGRWWALMTDGFYVCDDLRSNPAQWVKVDKADVPADIKRRMVEELTNGTSLYDDIDA